MSVRHKPAGVRAPRLKRAAAQLFLAAISCALLAASHVPAQVANGDPSSPALKSSAGDKKDGFDLVSKNVDVRGWPIVQFGFDISREDKTPFGELKAGDIKVYVDGYENPIAVKAGDIKATGNEPNNYLFMLDASQSMLPQEGTSDPSSSINKLEAARNALYTFVDRMRPGDKAALAVFAREPKWVVAEPTGDQKALKESVSNLQPRPGGTALYDAIEFAIEQARRYKIRDIVVLSDGVDMSYVDGEARYPSHEEKQRREAELVEAAFNARVRVFTIAIGDRGAGGPHPVDADSLDNISRQANGKGSLIPLTELETEASHNKELFNRLVVGRLKDSLDAIQQASRFTYSLTLDLRPYIKPGAEPRAVTVVSSVGTTELSLKQDLNWSLNSARPLPGRAEISKRKTLVQPPTVLSTSRGLSQIYLAIFVILGCMTALPVVGGRVAGRVRVRTEARRARKAVGVVGGGSTLVGDNCPNESRSRRYTFKQGDVILRCPKCKTVYHLDCWLANQCTCTVHDCRREMVVPRNILNQYGFDDESELDRHERQD